MSDEMKVIICTNTGSPIHVSESNFDTAPLELTVTTSITSLTPTSSSSSSASTISHSPSSSTLAAVATSGDDCSILDVGAMVETGSSSISPKSEMENELEQHFQNSSSSYHRRRESQHQSSIILRSENEIKAGARFLSFADFERVFENWKTTNYHPFRVASSETLRLPDGSTNQLFKYRYIVYHCAHYGAPRMRGVGKRPNQNYMPCGCKAMLRLNYSWSENALRVTTLNDEHIGHETNEDAYYKFAAKAKQRQSSSSPPTTINLPPPSHILSTKRPRSESPYNNSNGVNQQQSLPPPSKLIKNGHHVTNHIEAPLNLSAKNGFHGIHQHHLSTPKRSPSMDASPTMPPATKAMPPINPTAAPALSVLMFNHQQQQQQQNAYHELIRLLSVNGATGAGLVTALGASGVRDCRTESDRHRLITPIMQTLTQHLATARGYEFDEKLRDLKVILKKWQFIPTTHHGTNGTPPNSTIPTNYVNRSASAAAAAAAMMVQAMSAGSGATGLGMTTNGVKNEGSISNGH